MDTFKTYIHFLKVVLDISCPVLSMLSVPLKACPEELYSCQGSHYKAIFSSHLSQGGVTSLEEWSVSQYPNEEPVPLSSDIISYK